MIAPAGGVGITYLLVKAAVPMSVPDEEFR